MVNNSFSPISWARRIWQLICPWNGGEIESFLKEYPWYLCGLIAVTIGLFNSIYSLLVFFLFNESGTIFTFLPSLFFNSLTLFLLVLPMLAFLKMGVKNGNEFLVWSATAGLFGALFKQLLCILETVFTLFLVPGKVSASFRLFTYLHFFSGIFWVFYALSFLFVGYGLWLSSVAPGRLRNLLAIWASFYSVSLLVQTMNWFSFDFFSIGRILRFLGSESVMYFLALLLFITLIWFSLSSIWFAILWNRHEK